MNELKDAVINGVLCYLSSARHTLTDQAMCTICLSYYSGDKISDAKDLLFKFANETIIRRRGEGKVKADLIDMIALLRKVDERKESLPQFLADGFSSMPPASGFETIAEHIINLTTEINVLKNEIESLRNKDIPEDKLTDIKEDIFDIKSMLMQKVTSGEPCIPTTPLGATKTKQLYADVASSSTSSKKDESDVSFALATGVIKNSDSVDGKNCDVGGENKFMSVDNGGRKRSNFNKGNAEQRTAKQQPHEQDAAGSKKEMEDKENNWQVHQTKKKRKEVIRGSKRVNGSFKSTVSNCDLYIGKCDSSVTNSIITSYIRDENDIDVVACECLNEYNGVKSFKVTLSFDNRNKLLSSSMWPENIVVRKFYNKKIHNNDRSNQNKNN